MHNADKMIELIKAAKQGTDLEYICDVWDHWKVWDPEQGFNFSTFTYREAEKALTWQSLDKVHGWHINEEAEVVYIEPLNTFSTMKNVFANRAQAEASLAMAQLTQLAQRANGGWTPNWANTQEAKYAIRVMNDETLQPQTLVQEVHWLVFRSPGVRDEFMQHHEKLLLEALFV